MQFCQTVLNYYICEKQIKDMSKYPIGIQSFEPVFHRRQGLSPTGKRVNNG